MSGDIAAPVRAGQLEQVPGTLGQIARERAADYHGVQFRPAQAAGPSFRDALARPGLSVIAEVKRASPSQGVIAELDPADTARAYTEAGAAALSVLTESRHFGGQLAHLEEVRAATGLPLLRKDFTVHPEQLAEAARAGASAVLLIVAVLGTMTAAYLKLARQLGLDALVEVHDEAELEIALDAGTGILGINNRNLKTLAIDLETAPRLAGRARAHGYRGLLVAESGYRTPAELARVEEFADAVLIGTGLAGSGDPGAALSRLLGAVGPE